MKSVQKFFVPLLAVGAVAMIYFLYFSPKGLGSFTEFDTNNNANKEIRVKVDKAAGTQQDPAQGVTLFYVTDANNARVLVHGPLAMPQAFDTYDYVTLRGHLHKEYFHATEILMK